MSAALLVLRTLLSHWRRRPVELATLLIGLAVATALWSGVQALNAQARDSYDRAAAVLGGGVLSTVTALDGQPFALDDYVTLRRAGWAVSPVLEGEVRVGDARLRVIGIEPLTLPPGAEGLRIGEGAERLTDFLTPPYLALAAPGTILDDRFPVLSPSPDLPPGTVLVDISVAERLLDAPGRVSRLLLPEARDLPPGLATRLQIRGPERDGDLERLTDSFHLNLAAFGLPLLLKDVDEQVFAIDRVPQREGVTKHDDAEGAGRLSETGHRVIAQTKSVGFESDRSRA